MPHIVLLGDSIFDNASYTRGGPDIISQLRQLLRAEWRASLLAKDGATTDDVSSQLQWMPSDASHLVLSVGGNNALMKFQCSPYTHRFDDAGTHRALESLAKLRGEVSPCGGTVPATTFTPDSMHYLQRLVSRPRLPADNLHGPDGFQRCHLAGRNRVRYSGDRPAVCLFLAC